MDLQTLEAAATWYVQLNATPPSEAEQQAHREWLAQHPGHRQAWARVERLQHQFGGLPADVVLPALDGVRARRRAVLKTLAILLAAGTGSWVLAPPERWMAEHRTAKGQVRHLRLEDGSQLDLNTDSAVDIAYDGSMRQVYLRRGEILIETAADPARRPFVVHTGEGSVRALGTRFSVRSEAGRSEVRVMEHTVELRPLQSSARVLRLDAGQQADFDRRQLGTARPLPDGTEAWAQGMLSVIEWRLADFLVELGRYRPGYLLCADTVADLRLSGAFRLDDTDTILENLAVSLPVRVRYLTRYWVRIEPV